MELARKRVAEEGYIFKKGQSRSKVYGRSESGTPKRPKYDEKMREERMQLIEEELVDLSRILQFKAKRLSQHEVEKKYHSCEQVTEQMMELKKRKRELEAERSIIVKKARRAKGRQRWKVTDSFSDTSDMAPSTPSSSRSVTPQLSSPSVNSSVPLSADTPVPLSADTPSVPLSADTPSVPLSADNSVVPASADNSVVPASVCSSGTFSADNSYVTLSADSDSDAEEVEPHF